VLDVEKLEEKERAIWVCLMGFPDDELLNAIAHLAVKAGYEEIVAVATRGRQGRFGGVACCAEAGACCGPAVASHPTTQNERAT
jgi:LmbE family N-acetylglucosaminyl deacetylase